MNIHGINSAQPTTAIRPETSVKRSAVAQQNLVGRDEMNISAQRGAQRVANANFDASEIRMDLVNRVRAEIAAGTYYSDEKLEIAFTRMFESFE
ncbi:MAG: flagellar biosynthesis anti-sigma factor FlgM [Planctomycetia bacterium]|nr:flagellar biosynthesis anti-sigma factor FlgM [Planctomycetia bacterium]